MCEDLAAVLADIEHRNKVLLMVEKFKEVTGLSIFDQDYIDSLSETEWTQVLKEATMIAQSELKVKQSADGIARAAADLTKEDDHEAFWRLYEALADKLAKREENEKIKTEEAREKENV